MYSLIFCLFAYWFICSCFTYTSSVVMLAACIFFCNKVCLIKQQIVSADGMPRLIPMQPACRKLNSNAYSVWSSIFKNSLSQVLFFRMHNKGVELVTWRYFHPAELVLFKNITSWMAATVVCFNELVNLFLFIYSLIY